MANVKTITELTTLATVDHSADWLPVVDASDTTESSYGTTKKAVVSQFLGDTGVQGDTGVAGDTGIGTKGDTGEQGDTGAASTIAGDTGVQGDTGVGTQGDTGEKGDTGADSTVAGDTGVQGDTGVGEKGDTGDQGDTGVGIQGDTGVGTQGDTGITGDTGVGIQGDTGEQGDTGIGQKGDTGEKGDTGVGEKGDTGEQGDTGADSTVAGPQGDTGVDGDTGVGEKGDTGEVGLSGDTGIQGDTGVGEKGDTGDQGDTGIEGDDGDIYATTSSTSINLDTVTGENTVTVGSGLAYSAAQSIIIANSDTNYIEATVVSYSGTTLTYTVGTVYGSGTYTSWSVNLGGAPGPQGDQGDTGVGTQGDTGVAGEDGDTGIQGDTGIGEKGDTGEDGGDGAVGATGADGEQGDTGVGIQGDTGVAGDTGVGVQGDTGVAGDTGIGTKGDTGAVGATGVGEQGDTGVSGSDGDTGIQGDTGVGVQGDTGSQGLQGDTGQDGDTGVGEQGDTGQTGDTGTGTKGDTGVQGETGVTYPWEGAWTTGTGYAVNDTVENGGSGYICTTGHTSGASTEPGVGASWTSNWDLFVEGLPEPNITTATTTNLTGYLYGDGSNVKSLGIADGWIPAEETWTYASATTFTISGDKTDKYQEGDKVKLTQTTAKYFLVTDVSYSSPNTTVTVNGLVLYTLANAAITSPYYSKMDNPQGFPQREVTLFYNASGSTTTPLTLSETSANFVVIELFTDVGENSVGKILNPNGDRLVISSTVYGDTLYQVYGEWSFSGTSMTRTKGGDYYSGSNHNAAKKVYKVIGYRW